MTEYEAFCRQEAPRRGITPDVAVWVCNSEGGLLEANVWGKFATGWSAWALQLHYGGAGYEHFGTTAGMGNDFTRLTGWQPGDPAAWRDAMRYGLDRARAGGWGPWYGAKKIGVTGFYGIDRSVPWSGTPADEWDYKKRGSTMPIKLSDVLARARSRIGDPYVWDGETPGAFDCSGFVKWCYEGGLTSFTDAILGETERVAWPAPGDIVLYEYKDTSQPGVRFPHVGLFLSDTQTLDARFGEGVGVHAQIPRATATRYYRRLPGVVVDTEVNGVPTPTPGPDPRDAEIAQLQAEVASLRADLADRNSKLGVVAVNYASDLNNLVNALRALNPAA